MTEENTNTITINKKQLWKYLTFFLLGIFLIGGFVTFRGGGSPTGNVIAVGGSGEVVEVKTTIQGFQYNPDTITVKKGSIVRLVIDNKDSVVHGLHLPQFGIVDSIPANGLKTVQFNAIVTATNGQAVPTCSQEHGEVLTFNVV